MSKVSVAAKAAFDAVVNFVGSTAFRHRAAVVAVPIVVEVIQQAQAAFTGADPGAYATVVVSTVAIAAINFLRGQVAPAS